MEERHNIRKFSLHENLDANKQLIFLFSMTLSYIPFFNFSGSIFLTTSQVTNLFKILDWYMSSDLVRNLV